ncbi:mitochondrial fission factor homolog B isoform X4 [Thalassophryne amazonica]|uniref:mitochondrial fission factor homolog B isoform X4 n=1 Tax=Thalassophryne amazonica TaxID=390379 RepID=UPI001471B211|nr:mitochondrial fission factor homolog B isoform X4 [Thalassophryne amazonica]
MVYNFIVSGAVPLFKRNQKVFLNSQMSTAAFPSPTAEMAEMNRIQYELEYTEGISQRMRIPEMLKVAPQPHGDTSAENQAIIHSVIMQVPERIVVAGHSNDPQFPRPRDLDLIQSTPLDTLSLKTPPRVLTLSERPLDFLEEEHRQSPYNSELRPKVRQQRERSISENAAVHNSQLIRDDSIKSSLKGGSTASSNPLHESRLALSTFDASLDVGSDDMTLVDATALRRQLIKLNRRLQHLEEENKERAKRDMMLYSATIAFWLINTWVWLRR